MFEILNNQTAQRTKNPLTNLTDRVVTTVATLFIPIPGFITVAKNMKGVLLSLLLNTTLSIIVIITGLALMITHASAGKPYAQNVTIPVDGSFLSTDIPLQNPLGGKGLSLVAITAGFMDPNYIFFGGVHTGVDFVPNSIYYQSNKIYQQTGDVIVYDTMNGTVDYYIDQYGSHTVQVINKQNSVKTIDMHLNKVFVQTGQTITAGTAIGTMGDTGFTTGEHLHYEIRTNQNGVWTPVNPLGYIQ